MKIRGILLGTAIAAMLPTAAMAAPEGFYVGVHGGTTWLNDTSFNWEGAGVSNSYGYDMGWNVGGEVGYKTAMGLRGEVELTYRWDNHIDSYSTLSTNPNENWAGNAYSLAIMGNVIYDIPTGTAITPYIGVGAGLGYTRTKLEGNNIGTPASAIDGSSSDWNFAYQGIAGVSYAVTDNVALSVDYRYFATLNPKYESDVGTVKGEYKTHNIMVGVKYFFGTPTPAPQPPAPTPAPQPQTEYLVFFDWDKANITPVSDKIIGDAAAAAGRMRAVGIHVVGHTDTSGSPAYNMKLSVRRAQAVKQALIKKGVGANQISIEGKGETQLLVPTGPNVREPSNRRAQILIRIK